MKKKVLFSLFTSTFATLSANAQTPEVSTLSSGDTSWMLVSSALVLLMTPGLAFFYGGLVRSKNVVSTIFQNFFAIGVLGVLWAIAGYSLVFGGDVGGMIGNLSFFMLNGVGQEAAPMAATIPHLAFMLFQGMFAIITPALITGAFAERVHFRAWMIFMVLWSLFIYSPVGHWVWGGGFLAALGAQDFAGGLVVHMTAGWSALVAAIVLGKRKGFQKTEMKAYDAGMVVLGASLLLFGWFGFNAGSALTAGGLASHAFATTFFAAAAAMLSWTLVDRIVRGKTSAIGAAVGTVVGLVAITPGAGYVTVGSSLIIGAIAGALCNIVALMVKNKFKIDDSLDVFACHGVGGLFGTLAVMVFSSSAVNSAAKDGLIYGGTGLVGPQLTAAAAVLAISVVGTFVLLKIVSLFSPLTVTEKEEEIGLDIAMHDEVINNK